MTGLEIPACALTAVAAALVLDQVGFLALVIGFFVNRLLLITPLTLSMNNWYAGQSTLAVLVVLLLAFAAFALHRAELRPTLRP